MAKRLWLVLSVLWSAVVIPWGAAIVGKDWNARTTICFLTAVLIPWLLGPLAYCAARFVFTGSVTSKSLTRY